MKNFGLSAKERVKKLSDFRRVFKEGKSVFSLGKMIKVYYLKIPDTESPEIKIAVTINKKNGNAVWRNRLRRLIKESYRLSKKEFLLTCFDKKCSLYLIVNPVGFNKRGFTKIKLTDIKYLVEDVLKKVVVEL